MLFRSGDVWQLGPHIVAVGDIEKGHTHELAAQCAPDMLYSDPPWGANLANSFRSQAGLTDSANYRNVLHEVAEIGMESGLAFIEMSVRDTGLLEQLLLQAGAQTMLKFSIKYSGNRPCTLIAATTERGATVLTRDPYPDPTGFSDNWTGTPTWAIHNFCPVGGLVIDPCTGLGGTLKAAHLLNRRFVGTEINPQKLAEVVQWAASEGLNPVKVGSL